MADGTLEDGSERRSEKTAHGSVRTVSGGAAREPGQAGLTDSETFHVGTHTCTCFAYHFLRVVGKDALSQVRTAAEPRATLSFESCQVCPPLRAFRLINAESFCTHIDVLVF